MHSLYTNEVSDCLKPAGISLTFIHRHAKNNANPCICSIALVSRRLSIIFVELSGHELCTEWRRSKLKNTILHSGQYRHIALLKRTHKQVKCVTVLFTKQHAYTLKEFLQFPLEIQHTERNNRTNPLFCKFVSIIIRVQMLFINSLFRNSPKFKI